MVFLNNKHNKTIWLIILFGVSTVMVSFIIRFRRSTTIPVNTNIPVFIISLKRATERREYVMSQLPLSFSENVVVFDAVDGMQLTKAQSYLMNKILIPDKFKPGQIGCFLSHVIVWKRIVDSKLSVALILEDDFKIVGPLPQILQHILTKRFDIVYLNHCFEKETGVLIDVIGNYSLRSTVKALCTTGYLIRYSGARTLLKKVFSQKTAEPIDNFIRTLYRKRRLTAITLIPPLVMPKHFESTINEKSNITKT